MRCVKCGMSPNNSVHKNIHQYGYHEFEEKPDTIEELAVEMALRARQQIMDILMGVGEMSEEDASNLIAEAVREIRVY